MPPRSRLSARAARRTSMGSGGGGRRSADGTHRPRFLTNSPATSRWSTSNQSWGPPLFITYPDGYEERLYRLPGAWVTVQPLNGAVRAFSITITDADMYYDTGPMTHGSIDLDLGRDTFGKAPPSDDEALHIGPRWASFVRYYSYGGVAGNRFYYLAFNGQGTGIFDNLGSSYLTGIYAPCGGYGTPPDPAKITANTLTVVSPEGTQDDMRARHIHGPHHDLLGLPSETRKRVRHRGGLRRWLRRTR